MRFLRGPIAAASLLSAVGACGPGGSADSNAGSGGVTGSGGALGTGGQATGGSSSGGTFGTGGHDVSGIGGGPSGGAPAGGAVGVGGGATSGGAGPEGSGGDGGGGKPAAIPSAGCGNQNPATGTSGDPLTVSNHQYYVKLPTNYDPETPYRVLMMFHPSGNGIEWAEQLAGYEATAAKDEAIRVYPKSQGSGWVVEDVPFFPPLHEKILGDYCVDEGRVFASGESSGGDFASILGCEHADKVRAIAPCATKDDGMPPLDDTRQCTGQVAAIVIHGIDDSVVGPENGPLTRDFYRERNSCTDMSDPVEGYTGNMSNCVLFQGCDAGFPVYWCLHDDPEYGGTSHGWPKFAAEMTWNVFAEY